MTDAPRFAWTRHTAGNWSAHEYAIYRAPSGWRIVRDGKHWDLVGTLPLAKRLCEADKARRESRAGVGSTDEAR